MCVALPGKVLSVEDGLAKVDFSGNVVTAHAGLVDVKPGDYALVHAGLVIQVMDESEALDLEELFREVEG
ncbi:MAG: HypC/HybG/HupF family hydrogenase formation chaperone [Oscillospiraceae bacterium]|nr:HypC/HybG/HupF family hydrogenase formation chaperone [Oscillospiraceae bacterium]